MLNAHATLWSKITNAGSSFKHLDRIISSKKSLSNNLESLYFLLKDHKLVLAARTVVKGCNSNSLGLSNSVSDFLEAVANSIVDAFEVISTEDLLARIAQCNKRFSKEIEARMEQGEVIDWDKEMVIIGMDVVALFPSMTSENSGQIIRSQIFNSGMTVEGLNYRLLSLYIKLNKDKTG